MLREGDAHRRARRCEHHLADTCLKGRLEHVKRSVDVDLIGREGILNGPRDGPECALVEYHFDVLSRLANNLEIPQVALDVIDKVEVGIEIFRLPVA